VAILDMGGADDSAIRTHRVRVRALDGAESDASVFSPRGIHPKTLIICTPAIGVSAHHYAPLANELASKGMCVVTAELRGVGSSSVRARRGVDFGYRELVAHDLPAVISAARGLCPAAPLVLLGHSIGAHVSAMHASLHPGEVQALVFIAAGTSFYKAWPFPQKVGLRGVALLARSVSTCLGYFPGHVFGVFGTEARRLMHEWASLTTRGRFNVTGSPHDFEKRFGDLTLPVLALSFPGDIFAPKAAVEHLLSKVPRATITHKRLGPAEIGAPALDHFRWTKYPADIAEVIVHWMETTPGILPLDQA
jgi:predicted alpha/beta hydrolase